MESMDFELSYHRLGQPDVTPSAKVEAYLDFAVKMCLLEPEGQEILQAVADKKPHAVNHLRSFINGVVAPNWVARLKIRTLDERAVKARALYYEQIEHPHDWVETSEVWECARKALSTPKGQMLCDDYALAQRTWLEAAEDGIDDPDNPPPELGVYREAGSRLWDYVTEHLPAGVRCVGDTPF